MRRFILRLDLRHNTKVVKLCVYSQSLLA
jgi:hypothetical protein